MLYYAEADGSQGKGETLVETCSEQQTCQMEACDQGMRGRWGKEFGGQQLVLDKKSSHVHDDLPRLCCKDFFSSLTNLIHALQKSAAWLVYYI